MCRTLQVLFCVTRDFYFCSFLPYFVTSGCSAAFFLKRWSSTGLGIASNKDQHLFKSGVPAEYFIRYLVFGFFSRSGYKKVERRRVDTARYWVILVDTLKYRYPARIDPMKKKREHFANNGALVGAVVKKLSHILSRNHWRFKTVWTSAGVSLQTGD